MITEDQVEQLAIDWFRELGCTIATPTTSHRTVAHLSKTSVKSLKLTIV